MTISSCQLAALLSVPLWLAACDSSGPSSPNPSADPASATGASPASDSASGTAPSSASSANSPPSASSSPSAGRLAPSSDIPLHRSKNVAQLHAAAKQDPPARATRSEPVRSLRGDGYVAQISDVRLRVGATGSASIELQPSSEWKLNTEYPAQIALSGLSFATTPRLELRSDEVKPEQYRATSGGLRLDLPLEGKSAGVDDVKATLRFGVCSAYTCELRKAVFSWRVTVE